MKKKILTFVLLCTLFLSLKQSQAQCHFDDWTALKALYESTNGDDWANNAGWDAIANQTSPPANCNLENLHGVYLDVTGRVENLILPNNGLSGIIPNELGDLSYLTELWLSDNHLNGSIPPELGKLSNLSELSLAYNQLSGSIPYELGNLSNLTLLYLYNNQFSSSIPGELGNLSKLTELGLSENQLTGVIPSELGNLNNLIKLDLGENQLSGGIPSELGNLSNLSDLMLYANQLSGNIPLEIGNLTNLIYLDLCNNQLNGNIPSQLGNLSELTILWLNINQLSGPIPPELGNLNKLTRLYLHQNQLSGNIPSELGNLSNLTWLSINTNQLNENIPTELANLSKLDSLILSFNNLSGCYANSLYLWCDKFNNENISDGNAFDIKWEDFCATGVGICSPELPNCHIEDWIACQALYESTDGNNWLNNTGWSQLTEEGPPENCDLEALHGVTLNEDGRVASIILTDNQLNGEIPPELGSLSNLSDLILNDNDLVGTIPTQIFELTNLTELDLSQNELDGNLSSDIQNLENLIILDLSHNQISENIPPEMGNLINLVELDLSNNGFINAIPPELGNLTNIEELDLSVNFLNSTVPASLGNLSDLTILNLSTNDFSGNIPPEFGDLTDLTILNLSENQFDGSIPESIGNLTNLENLDLSYNELSGDIPVPILENIAERTDLSNNNFVCSNFKTHILEDVFYTTQSFVPENYSSIKENVYKDAGIQVNITVELPDDENTTDLSLQWRQNGKAIEAANQATLTINNLDSTKVGKYTLQITSQCLENEPPIVRISKPIFIFLEGYNLQGQPVEYHQLIVEYYNKQYKDSLEQIISNKSAYWVDKYDCERELHLYHFPDFKDAYKVLVTINTKVEVGDQTTEVDGGNNNYLINAGFNTILNFNLPDITTNKAFEIMNTVTEHSFSDSVTVYILDTGLDEQGYDATQHQFEKAPIDNCCTIRSPGYSYAGHARDAIHYYKDTCTISPVYTDVIGHGTFGFRCIAAGLPPNSNIKIVPLQITNSSNNGNLFDLLCGMYHAIDHNADIMNISAGIGNVPNLFFEQAIGLAKEKGIFIVTSTGNWGLNLDFSPQYPANYATPVHTIEVLDSFGNVTIDTVGYNFDHVISVASINAAGLLAPHSNYSKWSATIAAPGENIFGYALSNQPVVYSGTSMAAFFTTLALALEISIDNTRSYQEVWQDFENRFLETNLNLADFTRTSMQLKFAFTDAPNIPGCMDKTACNFDPFATQDDNTCIFCNPRDCTDCYAGCAPCPIEGCTNPDACNYDPNVLFDDGSCRYSDDCLSGCDTIFGEFSWLNNLIPCNDDEIKVYSYLDIYRFIDVTSGENRILYYGDGTVYCQTTRNDNFCLKAYGLTQVVDECVCDITANSIVPINSICEDPAACNFEESGSCEYDISGCPNPCDESSCTTGCTDTNACNFDVTAAIDDGSCYFIGDSCDDENPSTSNDIYTSCNTCEGTIATPCNSIFEEFNWLGEIINCEDDEITIYSYLDIYKFIDVISHESRILYYSDGTVYCQTTLNDDSCLEIYGLTEVLEECVCNAPSELCDNPTACNFGEMGSCDYGNTECPDPCDESNCLKGCTDINACNFDPSAIINDSTCYFIGDTCDDSNPSTSNDVYTGCNTCEGTIAPPCNLILEEYNWLPDEIECKDDAITIYAYLDIYKFIDVISGEDRILYYSDGTLYCQTTRNDDSCIEAYGLTDVLDECICNTPTQVCDDPVACNFEEMGDCQYGNPDCEENCDEGACCNNHTGIVFGQNCGGSLYIFVEIDGGQIFDPYFDLVDLQPLPGQTINFDFEINNEIVTPCDIAEQAITITCLEIVEEEFPEPDCNKNEGTIFFDDCGDTNYNFIETLDGHIYDPYYHLVDFEIYAGMQVKFDFIDNKVNTPCNISEKAITITCIEEIDKGLFEEYFWLNTNVDLNNCSDESITVYDAGDYNFIFVQKATGNSLYYQDGTYYCSDSQGFSCVEAYGLSDIVDFWSCQSPLLQKQKLSPSFKLDKKASFNLYPNPTTGKIFIELDNQNNNSSLLTVYDLTGKPLYQSRIESTQTVINLSSFTKGIYMIQVENTKEKNLQKLLIK